MHSPWLEIPLEDYEAHMSLPSVGQAQMLADQLGMLIAQHAPASVAVIGCAGGNGLDRCASSCVKRVVAIDINSNYIAACKARFANRLANLELHCADVESQELQFAPVDLIYAALVFEYADVAATLATCKRNLRPGGALAVLLQLAHTEQPGVSPSPYTSLNTLAKVMQLRRPADLGACAAAAGFELAGSNTMELPSGKRFLLQTFVRSA
jgi:SAM-dependent methyltransferase